MSDLLTALQTTGMFLGTWSLVSIAATVPLIAWLRAQGAANALHDRASLRETWLAEAQGATFR